MGTNGLMKVKKSEKQMRLVSNNKKWRITDIVLPVV